MSRRRPCAGVVASGIADRAFSATGRRSGRGTAAPRRRRGSGAARGRGPPRRLPRCGDRAAGGPFGQEPEVPKVARRDRAEAALEAPVRSPPGGDGGLLHAGARPRADHVGSGRAGGAAPEGRGRPADPPADDSRRPPARAHCGRRVPKVERAVWLCAHANGPRRHRHVRSGRARVPGTRRNGAARGKSARAGETARRACRASPGSRSLPRGIGQGRDAW